MEYTYDDLLDRLTDLKALAVPPAVGETSGCFSSYDRRSRYNEATGLYEDWGANSDGDGYIRREGEDIVALEIDGPGVIWRAWSANPQMGHIRVYIDGAAAPALDMPFRDLFERFDAEGDQFWPANFPRLMPTLSRGRNRFIPICFSTGCKITLGPSWGMFYHFTYTKFPAGTVAPAYSAALERAAQTRLAEIDRALALRGKLPMDGMEWRQVPCTAGESTVLYQSDTPGALTAFALEVPEGMPPAALENLLVEMYWDGAAQPSVACPLPNLFACTAAGAEDFRCLPVAKSGGLYACFCQNCAMQCGRHGYPAAGGLPDEDHSRRGSGGAAALLRPYPQRCVRRAGRRPFCAGRGSLARLASASLPGPGPPVRRTPGGRQPLA